MEIQEQMMGAVCVIKPLGPLVEPDVQQFRIASTGAAQRCVGRVVVDASAVAFLDSTGLEVLADLTDSLASSGRSLKLCGATATVKLVLKLTGCASSFEFYDDVNSGVRSFL